MTDTLTQWDNNGRDDGTAQSQTVATHYTYNVIGDVLTAHDENEDEIPEDDTFTVITYSDCTANRAGSRVLGAGETWVSVPQTVTLYGNNAASGERLQYRNGGPSLCANATPIRIAELVEEDDGVNGALFAITELSFDTHGSYNSVARPTNALPTVPGDYHPRPSSQQT